MVFITAGFGGGTGTGAAPVIAEICKELGALDRRGGDQTIFALKAKSACARPKKGSNELKEVADTVITIPNDRLRGLASKNATHD